MASKPFVGGHRVGVVLIARMCTQSWALVADPADRDAAIGAVRTDPVTRPETSSGAFDLPLRIEVLRAVRSSP